MHARVRRYYDDEGSLRSIGKLYRRFFLFVERSRGMFRRSCSVGCWSSLLFAPSTNFLRVTCPETWTLACWAPGHKCMQRNLTGDPARHLAGWHDHDADDNLLEDIAQASLVAFRFCTPSGREWKGSLLPVSLRTPMGGVVVFSGLSHCRRLANAPPHQSDG